jgi:hypothetical protein
MAMDKNAYELVSKAGMFIDSEWVDPPSAARNGGVPWLRADDGDGSGSPLPGGLGHGGSAERTEGVRSGPRRGGMDRDAKRLRGGVGDGGQRDPVAVYRTEILCRLLEPIHPAAWGGCRVLWPLWADEMVHRTYVTIHLTSLRMAQLRWEADAPMRFALDYGVADNLAASLGELAIGRDDERLPCSAVLRGIARNLVELFGPVAGNVGIATRIEPLQLAAFKRRALGLVVADLITASLIDGSEELEGGQIEVRLAAVSRGRGRLTVSGRGIRAVPGPHCCPPIGQDLASLLEADIVYGGPGVARIDFRA